MGRTRRSQRPSWCRCVYMLLATDKADPWCSGRVVGSCREGFTTFPQELYASVNIRWGQK